MKSNRPRDIDLLSPPAPPVPAVPAAVGLTPVPSSVPPSRRPTARARVSLARRAANAGLSSAPLVASKRGRRPAANLKLDGSLSSVCAMLGSRSQGVRILVNLIRACASVNKEAASFVDLYDSKTSHFRSALTPSALEDLATEADLPWPRLVAWAYESAISTGQHLASMKAALALPSVVDQTIKFAKRRDGHRDRDFLYRSTGFIPTPGGVSIVNQVAASAQARNISLGEDMFTPFERDIAEVTKAVSGSGESGNDLRILPDAAAERMIADDADDGADAEPADVFQKNNE